MNLYFLIWLVLVVGYALCAYKLLCHLERVQFTDEEEARLRAAKARYEAGTLTDDDIDEQQVRAW